MAHEFATINLHRIDIPSMLQRMALFRDLPSDALERTVEATQAKQFPKGAAVFQEGDAPRFFFFIALGQVKEAVRSPNGDEKIIEIIGAHRPLGETAAFLDRPYPFFAECLQDSVLLCLAKKTVFDLIETYPSFARQMLAGLSMRLHSLVSDIESYTLHSAEQRFIDYLVRNGDAAKRGASSLKVSLPATKLAIASRLGMSPETLSRILKAFVEAGLIDVRGKHVSIPDPERLCKFGC